MVELHKHQADAVEVLDNGKILWGGVGTGKSLTAVAYYMKREAPRNVYAITTAKKRDSLDWENDFAKYGVGKVEGATVAGVLTVDSWNNIGNYEDVEGAFFIFDEQRLVGSGSWTKAFLKIAQSNRWILLSATPGDTWLDYVPVFLANGFYRNRTEFIREHVVYNTYAKFPKVERYRQVNKLVRLRNELLVEMPYVYLTTRHTQVVDVDYDRDKYKEVMKKRWNVYEDKPIRDVAELFRVLRKIVNSDTSRLEAVKRLLHVHPRLVVFYNFDYELEALRTLAERYGEAVWSPENSNQQLVNVGTGKSSGQTTVCAAEPGSTSKTPQIRESFAVAEWNGHKHQSIPDTDRWVYLVQYAAGSEGWNCTSTNAMVFYSLTYSYKMWHQAHGRIDRLDTPHKDLYYYVLRSEAVIDRLVANTLDNKKSFNEKRFVKHFTDTRA